MDLSQNRPYHRSNPRQMWALESLLRQLNCNLLQLAFSHRNPRNLANHRTMERGTGFEPATICLEGRDSTPELPPLILTPRKLEPGTGIEPVTSSLPRTRSTN